MQQLTGVDASFLSMETGTTFGHVCGVVTLDPDTPTGPLTFDTVRTVAAQRLHLLPPLRRKLVEVPFGIDRPYWVDDPHFDLDFHVRELGLPTPGTAEQLAEQVARIASRPLDRGRPLWELYLLTGLEDGRMALMAKFHHAAVDGVAGAELVTTLFDTDPVPPAPTDPPPWQPERVPGDGEMWVRGLVGLSTQPLRMLGFQRRVLRTLPRSTRFLGSPDGQLLGGTPLVPPKTSFNRSITAARRWAFGTASLSTVKAVKSAAGVTVNDVVMAACAGGLRRWLQEHDELPSTPLVAMVPLSIRTAEEQGGFGNRVSAMVAPLPTHLADPLDRLRAVHESMRVAKEQHRAIGAETLQGVAEFAVPALATRAARVASQLNLADYMTPPYNLTVSNVPGPRVPLYLAGARVLGYYPVSVVADGFGLNITVQSYLDNLDFGLVACRELVPDLWDLLRWLTEAVDELADATGVRPSSD